MTKLIVKGMHCSACQSLIKMELEEKGLPVQEVKLLAEDRGEVEFADLNEEQINLAKKTIEKMDNYSVIS